jgi:hypothetical protein
VDIIRRIEARAIRVLAKIKGLEKIRKSDKTKKNEKLKGRNKGLMPSFYIFLC